MDSTSSSVTGEDLRARIQTRVRALLKAYGEVLDGAQTPANPTSLSAVTTAYKIDLATQSMIRASEDLLALIRQMQEIWLFGKLDTLGRSEVEERTEQDAQKILELLGKMVEVKGK